MSDRVMHQTPHWSVAPRRQFALLRESRAAWAIIGVCCLVVFLTEFLRIQRMGDSGMRATTMFPQYPMMSVRSILNVLAAVWPLLVWRDESWGKRQYHWSLPVDRSVHDLWRVIAGAAWLIISVAACAILGMTLLHLHGGAPVHGPNGSYVIFSPGAGFWLSFFAGPLIVYTFASILPIALRRPMEWGLAGVVGLMIWLTAAGVLHKDWMGRWINELLIDSPVSLYVALDGGMVTEWLNFLSASEFLPDKEAFETEHFSRWMLAVALWLCLGILGVLVAVRRRR